MKCCFGFVWVGLLFVAGCTASRPVQTYRRFTHAWARHEGRTVHALVSARHRETSSPVLWARASRDPQRKAVFLTTRGIIELIWSAEVKTESLKQHWRYTARGWRLVSAPFPEYLQDTPDHAVEAFIRALEFSRFDVLARLLPDEIRLSLSPQELRTMFDRKRPEVAALLSKLKKVVGFPVLVNGNTATLPYDENRRLRLVRTDRGWCIVEPE